MITNFTGSKSWLVSSMCQVFHVTSFLFSIIITLVAMESYCPRWRNFGCAIGVARNAHCKLGGLPSLPSSFPSPLYFPSLALFPKNLEISNFCFNQKMWLAFGGSPWAFIVYATGLWFDFVVGSTICSADVFIFTVHAVATTVLFPASSLSCLFESWTAALILVKFRICLYLDNCKNPIEFQGHAQRSGSYGFCAHDILQLPVDSTYRWARLDDLV